MTWQWITRRGIFALHERSLAEHGGATGIRDEGILESALTRPEQLAQYGEPTVFELAAAYAYGLVKNHPFIDGNKRTGFVAAYLFLAKNGYSFAGSEISVVEMTLGLAAGEISEAQYADWLKDNSEADI